MQKNRIGLNFDAWPVVDQAVWRGATAPATIFASSAPWRQWRKETWRDARYGYGNWLGFLSREHPTSLDEEPDRRVTPERLTAFVEALARRVAPATVAISIGHLILALRVMAPSYDVGALRQLQYRFEKIAKPKDKRSRMVDAACIYDLGLRLMDHAMTLPDGHEARLKYRDGLILAMLIAKPLRLETLFRLEVDKHLRHIGKGYVLLIDGEETKNGQPDECILPFTLTPYLERYLRDFRRQFIGANRHQGLWPSTKGQRMCKGGIYQLVCRRTRNEFGFHINPHLFRDIATAKILRDSPEKIGIATGLLGHSRQDITDKYYRQADSLTASRKQGALIAALRNRGRNGHSLPPR